ncbi:MAG: redoxin domain-containing protein [Lewinellaceae bacterium]|nr:redoxin domain-containing protein [Lewinellaceae bacterium]
MKIFTQLFFGLLLSALPYSTNAQVGNAAPNFTVTDTHGDTHTLYHYLDSGKVVVLDFFYTTCIPCQYYSPQVNAAYEKYGCNTGKVVFMSIDYNDTNAEVLAYDQQYNILFPSVSGLGGGGNSVVSQYNIQGFPTLYVIDSTKKIIAQIDPPTLQVFDFRFQQHGILPAECLSAAQEPGVIERLDLFPNPVASRNNLNVRLPESTGGLARFEILNILGQSVQRGVLDFTNTREGLLEIGSLSAGLYLLNVKPLGEDKTYLSSFVVN